MDEPSGRTLKTTETSFDIIEYIKDVDGATLDKLATNLNLAKSTVHAHVTTLAERGYLTKVGNQYEIGLEFFHLGVYARDRNPAYQLALENVRGLARTTNEESTFSVEAFGRVITLFDTIGYEADQNQNVGVFRIGQYHDMHCTAVGKALLAAYSDDRVVSIINRRGLPAQTSNTITEKADLIEELEKIRERGYAINDEEYIEGHRSVAVAVREPNEEILGALSIQGPSYRLTVDRLIKMSENVLIDNGTELEQKLERAQS